MYGVLHLQQTVNRQRWYVRTARGMKQYHEKDLEYVPPCPWRNAIAAIVGEPPPDFMRGDPSKLTDAQYAELQDWIGSNLQHKVEWSTALGVIEAAQLLVTVAKDNGNFSLYEKYRLA